MWQAGAVQNSRKKEFANRVRGWRRNLPAVYPQRLQKKVTFPIVEYESMGRGGGGVGGGGWSSAGRMQVNRKANTYVQRTHQPQHPLSCGHGSACAGVKYSQSP